MYQINNEQFGKFVSKVRKEKNYTQKQMAEKLFVSDKTVSKWERGASMPNVVLLIPIADGLGITITELLKGERTSIENGSKNGRIDNLLVESLDLTVQNTIHQHKKYWILAYLICLFITIAEIGLLSLTTLSLSQMKENVLLICGLMLVFSGWFCFFSKNLLPTYYDKNKINYYAQGIFRFHMVGLSFNNGNWTSICSTCKIGMMIIAVLYPLSCYGIIIFGGNSLWGEIKTVLPAMMFGLLIIAIYVVGKKYE